MAIIIERINKSHRVCRYCIDGSDCLYFEESGRLRIEVGMIIQRIAPVPKNYQSCYFIIKEIHIVPNSHFIEDLKNYPQITVGEISIFCDISLTWKWRGDFKLEEWRIVDNWDEILEWSRKCVEKEQEEKRRLISEAKRDIRKWKEDLKKCSAKMESRKDNLESIIKSCRNSES